MVRTKGDSTVTKVVGSKAPRKQLVSSGGASSSSQSTLDSSKKRPPISGLPYCPQPTPEWQKSVKSFFKFTPRTEVHKTEDKENEMQTETIDLVEKSTKDKGKGPAKGKKATKKKSKQIEEVRVDTDNNVNDEDNDNNDEDNDNNDEDNDNNDEDESSKEPVVKKRNMIIESDDD